MNRDLSASVTLTNEKGQGQPSLNLTFSFIIWITGIIMEVTQIIGVKIS